MTKTQYKETAVPNYCNNINPSNIARLKGKACNMALTLKNNTSFRADQIERALVINFPNLNAHQILEAIKIGR